MTNCLSQYATTGEARVARKLVKAMLDAGYTVSVNDGEEWTVKRAWRLKTVLDALASTDADTLRIRNAAGESCGTFYLVWGNDPSGEELIADHSDNADCEALYATAHGAAIVTVPAWHGEA